MFCSRRHLLAASAALPMLSPREAGAQAAGDDPVSELLALSQASNAALMRGDIEAYRALITLAPDFALMSPFGGKPTHAAQVTAEAMQRMGRFFRNGDLRIEVVQTWAVADMVVLAYLERSRVEVGGLPSQEWALRVTLVYRRDKDGWVLAHRHADPLVGGIGLQEAAALAARPAPTP
jgi:ketosteroid isomerase-like protein